jgi:hypothetical protein
LTAISLFARRPAISLIRDDTANARGRAEAPGSLYSRTGLALHDGKSRAGVADGIDRSYDLSIPSPLPSDDVVSKGMVETLRVRSAIPCGYSSRSAKLVEKNKKTFQTIIIITFV